MTSPVGVPKARGTRLLSRCGNMGDSDFDFMPVEAGTHLDTGVTDGLQ